MNSKSFLTAFLACSIGITSIITLSGCNETPSNGVAASDETPHVQGLRDVLKKIATDGKDKKSLSDLGMSYPMALARNKTIVEPTKPLFDKLNAASTPEERQKIAQEMLDALSPSKT
ncbi:hypothetical protein [Lacunimicrobium album]